jgi:membrane-bound serine protease (ClpP class)
MTLRGFESQPRARSAVGGPTHRGSHRRMGGSGLLGCAFLTLAMLSATTPAQEAAPKPEARENAPVGQFVTVSAPVDDVVFGRVSRAALALQTLARQEKRSAVLVLEVLPGTSQFHHVQGLAKFLTTAVPEVLTVAWVPETLRGNQAIIALACKEIVMLPEAEFGDLGVGKALEPDEQAFVVSLANRRHNLKLSEALVRGMADPQAEVIWAQVEVAQAPQQVLESRVIAPAEFERLLKARTVIPKHEAIKTPGTPGLFSGEKCRSFGMLITRTATDREEVAEAYRLPRESMREKKSADDVKPVVIRVHDMIEPVLEQFVVRQIDRAVAEGRNLIIFDVESPGGYLDASMNLATRIAELHEHNIRTVAYIPKEAISGAAIISLGADEIYMLPEAKIGDAAPIEVRGGGWAERAPEKILSILTGFLRELAGKKKRSKALCEAMADRKLVVFQSTHKETGEVAYLTENEIHEAGGTWIQGRPIAESGRELLLTVNGKRAHELKLAETPVASFDELKQRLGLSGDISVPVAKRTWVDDFVFVLNVPAVTVLLFMVAIGCIYMELHFPIGLFGIVSAVCFTLFFWSRFLGGTSGWLEVCLFLLGTGMVALEVFLLPGFLVFGLSGALLILFSIVLATQTFVIPLTQGDYQSLGRTMATIAGSLVGMGVMLAFVGRFLPSIPFFEGLVLQPPGVVDHAEGPRLDPSLVDQTRGSSATGPLLEPGRRGVAETLLRPSGKVRFGDDLVDVVSEGLMVRSGTPVEIVEVSSMRVVVRAVDEAAPPV